MYAQACSYCLFPVSPSLTLRTREAANDTNNCLSLHTIDA